MIKNEIQSQFNFDFEKVLERSNLDPVVSKISDSLISAVRSDLGRFYFVAFIHRDKDEAKLVVSYRKNKMNFTPNQSCFDIFSWIPVLCGNLLELFNNKSFSKKIGEDFSKNPLSVETLEKNRDLVKEFVRDKINSKLLKDQKIRLRCYETGDWSPFLRKFKRGDSYPIDVFPEKEQFELFWSKTELFGNGYSTVIDKELRTSSDTDGVMHMVFAEDFSLKKNFKRFETIIDSIALKEIFNPEIETSIRERITLYLIQKNKVSENDLVRALDLSINSFIEEIEKFENPLYDKGFLKIISKFPGLDNSFVKERFMNKVKSYFFDGQYKTHPFFEILPTYAYEEFKSLGLIKEEAFKDLFNFLSCVCYPENKISYSPLFGSLYFLGMDTINDDLDHTYKLLEETILLSRASIKTSKKVKEEVRFLLDSSMINLPERIIQHLNFVLTMDEW